jgi:hypothetical protein
MQGGAIQKGRKPDRAVSWLRVCETIDVGGVFSLGGHLFLDGFVDFFAVYGDVSRRRNPQSHLVPTYIYDSDLNVVADHDCFIALSRQYQHRVPFHETQSPTIHRRPVHSIDQPDRKVEPI